MKLLSLYSSATGLKIKNQFLLEKFYPLSTNKYISIQSSSGMQAKNYPYFNEVIDIVYPLLRANNISIIQLGDKNDPIIKNCINLQGKTDIHQSNYILSRSILHVGNDSWIQHRTGYLNIPIVDVFGPTSIENHSPYQYHPNSQFIEAHRWGKKPTFASQENPSSIATIRPEDIAKAVFKGLGANINIPVESLLIGNSYNQTSIEWVPDALYNFNFSNNPSVIARCDYSSNEDYQNYLLNLLSKQSIFIISDKEIDLNLLNNFKKNINLLILKINKNSNLNYIKSVKNLGIKIKVITEEPDDKDVSDLRLKCLDFTPIERMSFKTKENFFSESEQYLGYPLDKNQTLFNNGDLWIKTNKFILSKNKIYLNKAAFKADIPTNSFENNIMPIIDNNDFWSELDYFYIFKQKQN